MPTEDLDDEETLDMTQASKDPDLKMFVYIVVLHPTKYERHRGATPKVIVPLGALLAKDEADVGMQVGPLIPEEHRALTDRIEVAARPF